MDYQLTSETRKSLIKDKKHQRLPKGNQITTICCDSADEQSRDKPKLFQLRGVIGQGGQGEIREALELHSKKTCAVKTFSEESMDSQEAEQRERKHLGILGRLLGHACLAGRSYLFMPFYTGGSLESALYNIDSTLPGQNPDRYAEKKVLPFNRRLELAIATIQAMLELHQKFILHRDIKPSNLILTDSSVPYEKVKLVDLASGVMINDPNEVSLRARYGSFGYIAPEMLRPFEERPDYSAQSDYFSLGVVLAEILSKYNFQAKLLTLLKLRNTDPNSQNETFQHLLDKMTSNPTWQQQVRAFILQAQQTDNFEFDLPDNIIKICMPDVFYSKQCHDNENRILPQENDLRKSQSGEKQRKKHSAKVEINLMLEEVKSHKENASRILRKLCECLCHPQWHQQDGSNEQNQPQRPNKEQLKQTKETLINFHTQLVTLSKTLNSPKRDKELSRSSDSGSSTIERRRGSAPNLSQIVIPPLSKVRSQENEADSSSVSPGATSRSCSISPRERIKLLGSRVKRLGKRSSTMSSVGANSIPTLTRLTCALELGSIANDDMHVESSGKMLTFSPNGRSLLREKGSFSTQSQPNSPPSQYTPPSSPPNISVEFNTHDYFNLLSRIHQRVSSINRHAQENIDASVLKQEILRLKLDCAEEMAGLESISRPKRQP